MIIPSSSSSNSRFSNIRIMCLLRYLGCQTLFWNELTKKMLRNCRKFRGQSTTAYSEKQKTYIAILIKEYRTLRWRSIESKKRKLAPYKIDWMRMRQDPSATSSQNSGKSTEIWKFSAKRPLWSQWKLRKPWRKIYRIQGLKLNREYRQSRK